MFLHQQIASERLMKIYNNKDQSQGRSALLQAPPGSGKTYLSFHMAAKLDARELVVLGGSSSREAWMEASKTFGIPCIFLTYKQFVKHIKLGTTGHVSRIRRGNSRYIKAQAQFRCRRRKRYLHANIRDYFQNSFQDSGVGHSGVGSDQTTLWVFDECHLLYENGESQNSDLFLCTSELLNYINQFPNHYSLLQTSKMRVDIRSARALLVLLGWLSIEFEYHTDFFNQYDLENHFQKKSFQTREEMSYTEPEEEFLLNPYFDIQYKCCLFYHKHVKWENCVYMGNKELFALEPEFTASIHSRSTSEDDTKFSLLSNTIDYLIRNNSLSKDIIKEHVECLENFKLSKIARDISTKIHTNPKCKVIVFLNANSNVEELKHMFFASQLIRPMVSTTSCSEQQRVRIQKKFQEESSCNLLILTYSLLSSSSMSLHDKTGHQQRYILASPTLHYKQLENAIATTYRLGTKSKPITELFLENSAEMVTFSHFHSFIYGFSDIENKWNMVEESNILPMFQIPYSNAEKEYLLEEKTFQQEYEWLPNIIFEIEKNREDTYFARLPLEILHLIFSFLV